MNNKNRQIKRDRKNPKCENYNSKDLIELVQLFLESILSIELEDTLSHNVHKLIVK
jgi:hypothetical protein